MWVLRWGASTDHVDKDNTLWQGLEDFFYKGQIVPILGFVGYMISVTTTQFYHCKVKTAAENTQMNGGS